MSYPATTRIRLSSYSIRLFDGLVEALIETVEGPGHLPGQDCTNMSVAIREALLAFLYHGYKEGRIPALPPKLEPWCKQSYITLFGKHPRDRSLMPPALPRDWTQTATNRAAQRKLDNDQ